MPQCTRRFRSLRGRIATWFAPAVWLLMAAPARAQDDALDTGDTAWILISTALVLFMTIPGLALFYGGLVRTKNVLSVLMQCLTLTAAVTLIWLAFGYSLAFDDHGHGPRARLTLVHRRTVQDVPARHRPAGRSRARSPRCCSSRSR